jgi:hypothetical protein
MYCGCGVARLDYQRSDGSSLPAILLRWTMCTMLVPASTSLTISFAAKYDEVDVKEA